MGQSTSHTLVLCSELINRLPSSLLNFDSLWEALFHFKPDLSQLKTFLGAHAILYLESVWIPLIAEN